MRQVKASKTKLDVSEQIFDATDRLMAKEGLHYLSMHKLAKEAGIAAGTIYLYFKSKDELLAQFARRVFNKFVVAIEEGFDESQSAIQKNVVEYLAFSSRKSNDSVKHEPISIFTRVY